MIGVVDLSDSDVHQSSSIGRVFTLVCLCAVTGRQLGRASRETGENKSSLIHPFHRQQKLANVDTYKYLTKIVHNSEVSNLVELG